MKTKHKKIIGSLLCVLILGSIGAALVNAQTYETTEEKNHVAFCFNDEHPKAKALMPGPFGIFDQANLSEAQQEELNNMIDSMREAGNNHSEIREAVMDYLDDQGILDEQLDTAIIQTVERLTILERTKELREEGYEWEEIHDLIEDEFDLELPQPLKSPEKNIRHPMGG